MKGLYQYDDHLLTLMMKMFPDKHSKTADKPSPENISVYTIIAPQAYFIADLSDPLNIAGRK